MTDTDIVTRLRTDVLWLERRAITVLPNDLREAADELERLAAELVEVGKVAIDRGNQLIAANAEIERLRRKLKEHE